MTLFACVNFAPRIQLLQHNIFDEEQIMAQQKSQQQIRFEKEAKALQKNIAKRKKQQQELDKKKQLKEIQRGQN